VKRLRAAEYCGALLVGVLILAWFFKYTVRSRFDLLPGNIGDAKFLLYLCEHWYEVFTGHAVWLSPGFFYPLTGTLGFSESLFLFGVVYSLFRVAGRDSYAAFELIVIGLPFLGYVGAWLMLRKWLRFSAISACLGAAVFAYSSALYSSMAHAQLEAVSFLPFMVMLLGRYVSRLGAQDERANICGLAFFVILPLLAYTSFYTTWFFLLWITLAASLFGLWLFLTGKRDVIRVWGSKIRISAPGIAANFAVGGIFSLPFLLTYVPALQLFSRRPFEEIVPMLPSPIDFLNVGFENYAWGWLLRAANPLLQARPLFWELDKGLPLILFIVFVCGTFASIWKSRYGQSGRDVLVLICAMTVWLAWFFMVKLDGYSLWWFVYRFFPGGGAIRAVYRFNINLMLPVVIVVGFVIDEWLTILKRRASRLGIIALIALAIAMVFEEGNRHRDLLSKSQERGFRSTVPPAPEYCRAMVIRAETDTHMGWWGPLQLDAMLIAQANRIPTLNGYSGWFPDDWALQFPTEDNYEEAVRNWATHHNVLSGLCTFHYETRQWQKL
jgi:hypothetical protein